MRIHTIDACLQRRNRLWTIDDLVEACENALYEYEGITEISTRTIRRDIQLMRSEKLGYCAPIIVTDKKYYTYADPDYSITKMPLSKEDLAELSSALDIIRHYGTFSKMAGQEDIITRMRDKIAAQQSDTRVVYIETNDRLKGIGLLGILYDHILNKTPLAITYRSFTAKNDTVQHISPYILKEFNNRWFLLGYSRLTKSIRTLALDRIIAITEDNTNPYTENSFFNPETYFGEMVGVTRGAHQPTEQVAIKVDKETAPYILTKPIHGSQRLTATNDDGSVEITLQVIPNFELERVLLGFGCHIEVTAPHTLRRNMATHMKNGAKIYE